MEEATQIFIKIINGNGTEAQNNVVMVNAAIAIQTYKQDLEFQEAFAIAKESLLDQKALQKLQILKQIR